MAYEPPVEEYLFLLRHVLAQEFVRAPGADRVDGTTLDEILTGIGRFAADRVRPLAQNADAQGCRIENGAVRTPEGFPETYAAFIADGWGGLHVADADGGQALPLTVAFAAEEFVSSGAMGFALYSALRLGAYKVLYEIGDNLDPVYRTKLGSGEWTGTMCLTEPQAGTDLSLLRTTAQVEPDGAYRLNGTKIFISGGDHDVTPNIVHLVLARIAGASAGISGLGLFLVPKNTQDEHGDWTVSNGVTCGRLEEKLGIHGSATAELLFEGARGWLIGTPGAGLAGMFIMMKMARVGTSFQAIGVAEIARQTAADYAAERIQGRDLTGEHGQGSISIAKHPNVRRELLRMRALTSGARMLGTLAAITFDRAASDDPEERQLAENLLGVLMPVSKAITSETGVDVATTAMQTLGGHGYIRDNGIEAMLRDVSILPIYEGTNDVQALDIVLRRVGGGGGPVNATLEWVQRMIDEAAAHGIAGKYVERMSRTFSLTKSATADVSEQLEGQPFAALQMARDYLWLLGHLIIGALWLRVLSSLEGGAELPVNRETKAAEVMFYFAYIHPDADLRAARLAAAIEVEAALRAA